ncbi:MarR family winged helix-turn-helix transcriptional regulator [Planctomicrobium sp. SH664]|uniref:MarR family winged helix-turn-helix transcriptional regulator n=1 Tax=Planctomicrobium sp. SH664 TaxID=3448125 RepID=UPI003F5C2069
MLEHDFQSDIGYWIHLSAHRFECAMNSELSVEGITYRQCQVLAWLALKGELSQVDLAKLAHVEPPTMARVLARMERDELIERTTDVNDRRRKMIRPTRKAVPVWKRIIHCFQRVRERSSRNLSEKQYVSLRRLLEQVHDNLSPPESPGEGSAEGVQPRNLTTCGR